MPITLEDWGENGEEGEEEGFDGDDKADDENRLVLRPTEADSIEDRVNSVQPHDFWRSLAKESGQLRNRAAEGVIS